jgi:hypothetical protein
MQAHCIVAMQAIFHRQQTSVGQHHEHLRQHHVGHYRRREVSRIGDLERFSGSDRNTSRTG